ncbi:MAG: sensor domain-containing diguanylate cyclase [Treponema sp.]|nr:sensor domain-containing diguanylate cyclase [Treponema sp.]
MLCAKTYKKKLFPLILFISVFTLLSVLYLTTAQDVLRRSKEKHIYIAMNEANKIKNAIDAIMSRTQILKDVMIATNGNVDKFDILAPEIYEDIEFNTNISLKNITLAPDGIVKKIYPLEGNENLINFNFMDETLSGNLEALDAFEKCNLVLTNPFNLVQGGTGFAGRLPIFTSNTHEKKFWGFTTITVDFEDFLKTIDMTSLSKHGINYHLQYINKNNEKITLTASPKLPENPVSYEFTIKNLLWHIELAPTSGWITYYKYALAFIIVFGFSFLLALITTDRIKIKDTNKTLERLVKLDALTGCYSRQFVNTSLINPKNGEWKDPNMKYSLAVVDVDYFKQINDTYGHAIGDMALVAVADVLKSHCKHENGDCVIRHGGDEFIVLYNDVTPERFKNKLDSLVNTTRNIRFCDYPEMRITLSVGEWLFSESQETYYEMTRQADKKLYEAKEKGRNQYAI